MAKPVKLPVGSGIDSICCLLQNVAVGGVDGIDERTLFDRNGLTDLADSQAGVHGDGSVCLDRDGGHFLGFKSVMRESQSVGADRKVHKIIAAAVPGLLGAGELSLVADNGHGGARQDAAGRISHRTGNAAQSLLGLQGRPEETERDRQ